MEANVQYGDDYWIILSWVGSKSHTQAKLQKEKKKKSPVTMTPEKSFPDFLNYR